MLILSNDYSNNLPNSKYHAKGGPANFAKRFKSFLKKEKHSWIGLIIEFNTIKSPKLKLISRTKGFQYYRLQIPGLLAKKIGRTPKKIDAEKLFEPVISLIAELVGKTNPDIVFLNGYAISNWLILKAAQKEKIPVAIQHAGIWTKELRIYKDFFSLAGRKIMEAMEKEIPKVAAAEIFLNDWSRKYFNANVAKTDKNKTYIIPLPVDFENYECVKVSRKTDQVFNIGVIARWDRIKNHEAVAALVKKIQKLNLPWQLHSVTVIPKTNKNKELKDFYRQNIDIVPPLDQKGIKKFCQLMDLLILPSHFDVSPNVVLEATGCNTPIAISENVGFVDDFKKYGAKDWIIDFNNPDSAVKRIKTIAKKPMPDRIKKLLASKHRSDRVFNGYMRLFRQIIQK